jgi:hypothetical protein
LSLKEIVKLREEEEEEELGQWLDVASDGGE